MNKVRDSKMDLKKVPIKTQKENRIDKNLKKAARQHLDFIVKPQHGPAY